MPQRRSRPDRLGGLLAGLARQLALPLFGAPALPPRPSAPTPAPTPPIARPVAPADIARRTVRLSDRTLEYTLRRGHRKTIGFSVAASGLTVAAPRAVGVRRIEDAIRERERWVLAKLDDARRHQAAIPPVRWVDGGTVPYRGEPVTLRIVRRTPPAGRTRAPTFDPTHRTLTVALADDAPPTDLRDRVTAWLRAEARMLFRERLAFYEARLGVRHRALRLSSARTRWGSCSADGRILLNWRLIHFPLSAVDYVVAHELSHLKEMNHGPRFWSTVAGLLPDYEVARRQVRNPPPEWLPTL